MSIGSRRQLLLALALCCSWLAVWAPVGRQPAQAQRAAAPPAPTIALSTGQPGNTFAPGTPINATITLSLSSGAARTFTRAESVQDFSGTVTSLLTDTVTLAPGQPTSSTIQVPTHGSGYYELDVALTEQGTNVPVLAALPIGVLRPRAAQPSAISAFGTAGSLTQAYSNDPTQLRGAARSMAAAGITYTREELNWQVLEHSPGSGQFDFARTDAGIVAAHDAGLQVLGLLAYWGNLPQPDTTAVMSGTETLQQVSGCSKGPACAYTPQGDALYARYATAMVARYRPGGTLAQQQGWTDNFGITNWEVWNEPSTIAFWRHDLLGYGDLFASLYKAAAAAIHGADPNARTMYDESGTAFDRALVANGSAHDILAVHTYTGGLDPDAALVQPSLPRGGQGTAPAAIGDLVAQGPPVWITETGFATDGTVTAHQQAAYLVRSFVNFLAAGVRKEFWFKFHEDSPGGDNLYSLVNRDLSPKPSYLAYATMTAHLAGATFARQVGLGSAIRADLFTQAGGGTLAVLWSTAESGSITIPGIGAGAAAYDLMDNATGSPAGDGLVLPLSGDPVFLSVQGLTPDSLATLLGRATIGTINPVGVSVGLAPGLSNGLPDVKVTISARTTAPISGTIALQLPQGWSVARPIQGFRTLQPGESTTLSFRLVSEVNHKGDTLVAVATTPQGVTARGSNTLSSFALSYGHPSIDGTLASWGDAAESDLIDLRPVQVVGIPGWTPQNLSARVFTMWDERYFYLAADVTDQTFDYAPVGFNMYRGDSLQLGWGMDPAAWNNDIGTNGYGIATGLTRQGPANFNYKEQAPWPDMQQQIKRDPASGHLIYTTAIPWSRLGNYVPRAGNYFAFDMIINQNENGNRIGWIQFTPGIGLGFHPSQYQLWTLLQGNPAAGLRLGAGAPLSGQVSVTLPTARGQLVLHNGGLQMVNLVINGTPVALGAGMPALARFGATTVDLTRYLRAGINTVQATGVPVSTGAGAAVLSFFQ